MIRSTVSKMADPIGFEIGNSDDVTQADLMNGFCRGLKNSCVPILNYESQLSAIVERLDDKSMKVIKDICEFIIIKEGE